jgi:hypothetical protein
MELKIARKNKDSVEATLTESGLVFDMLIMPLDFNFDTVLVTSIDKLFKRNRISRVSPLSVVLEGFGDDSGSSSLIARTVAEALKIK